MWEVDGRTVQRNVWLAAAVLSDSYIKSLFCLLVVFAIGVTRRPPY